MDQVTIMADAAQAVLAPGGATAPATLVQVGCVVGEPRHATASGGPKITLDVKTWMADLHTQPSTWWLELEVEDVLVPRKILLEVIPFADGVNSTLEYRGARETGRLFLVGCTVMAFRNGGDFMSMVAGTPPRWLESRLARSLNAGARVLMPIESVVSGRPTLTTGQPPLRRPDDHAGGGDGQQGGNLGRRNVRPRPDEDEVIPL